MVREPDRSRRPRLPSHELTGDGPDPHDELDDSDDELDDDDFDDDDDEDDDDRRTRASSCASTTSTTRSNICSRATSTSRARMPYSSNATFLVHVTHDGQVAPGDLQADARRATAVGLRARTAPSRGRHLPDERGARPRRDSRRRCCATARSARVRCSGSSPATISRALLHDPRDACPNSTIGCGPWRCSTSSATTPTARAAIASSFLNAPNDGRRRRPRCGASTTGCASLPSTSCAR